MLCIVACIIIMWFASTVTLKGAWTQFKESVPTSIYCFSHVLFVRLHAAHCGLIVIMVFLFPCVEYMS